MIVCGISERMLLNILSNNITRGMCSKIQNVFIILLLLRILLVIPYLPFFFNSHSFLMLPRCCCYPTYFFLLKKTNAADKLVTNSRIISKNSMSSSGDISSYFALLSPFYQTNKSPTIAGVGKKL